VNIDTVATSIGFTHVL